MKAELCWVMLNKMIPNTWDRNVYSSSKNLDNEMWESATPKA